MQQRRLVRLAQIVIAVAPGVAQHAPAARAQQHRRGTGAIAFFPAAGIGDFQFAALELEAAVLLSAAVEMFAGLAGQHLHALLGVQIQRLQLAPQRRDLVAGHAFERQAQRLALDAQHQRGGADARFPRVFLETEIHLARRLRQHDRRGLVAGRRQLALAAGLHAHGVGAQQIHAHPRAAVGGDVPAGHAVTRLRGLQRAHVAHVLGKGGGARGERQQGEGDEPVAAMPDAGFQLAPQARRSGSTKPLRPTLGQRLEKCQQIAKKKEGYFLDIETCCEATLSEPAIHLRRASFKTLNGQASRIFPEDLRARKLEIAGVVKLSNIFRYLTFRKKTQIVRWPNRNDEWTLLCFPTCPPGNAWAGNTPPKKSPSNPRCGTRSPMRWTPPATPSTASLANGCASPATGSSSPAPAVPASSPRWWPT